MTKAFTLISLVLLINIITACSSQTIKPILEDRAGYGPKLPPFQLDHGKADAVRYVPTRVPEKVAVAWLFPHELPSRDYFWGSWLSIVVSSESWEMKKVEIPQSELELTKSNPIPKALPPRKVKNPAKK